MNLMKNLTATILALAMLCAVSCTGNTTTPAETTTTTTTVGDGASTSREETTEITAPVEVILDEAHASLPVYTTDRDVSVFYEIGQEYENTGTAPEAYVVRFEDAPAIALVLTTHIGTPSGKLDNTLTAIYVGSYKHECNIGLFDGDGLAVKYTKDVICAVPPGASVPGEAIIVCENGAWESSGSDEYFITAESDGEIMTYCRNNRKIFAEMNQIQQWAAYADADTVYRISGTVKVTDSGIVMEETARLTIAEYYLTEEMASRREKSGCDTFAELKEKHATAAFPSTVPVYESAYDNYDYSWEFDRIAKEEYAKYAAGEDFDEYFAIRLTEYPDIVLVGRVITEPGLLYNYQMRGLDSVIYNGERHYTPNYNNGVPGYGLSITEDFICVTSATNHYNHAYFIYDGGTEYIEFTKIEKIPRPLDCLYASDGVMKYSCYSSQYSSVRFTPGYMYDYYESPDDCLYYEGTIGLENGKIKIISRSYTVAEWYAAETKLHEISGTTDVAEFMMWLKDNRTNEDVHIDPIGMYAP